MKTRYVVVVSTLSVALVACRSGDTVHDGNGGAVVGGEGGQDHATGTGGNGGRIESGGAHNDGGAPLGGNGGAHSDGGAPPGGAGGTALNGGAGASPGGSAAASPGGAGGTGGNAGGECPYEIVRDPTDSSGFSDYTKVPLDHYCLGHTCPRTLEELEAGGEPCYENERAWRVEGCGYTHVWFDDEIYNYGYIFDDVTGRLVGAYFRADSSMSPCGLYGPDYEEGPACCFDHSYDAPTIYGGMMPEACFDLGWDSATGEPVAAGGGAGSTITSLCAGMGGAGGQGPGGAGGRDPGGAAGQGPGGGGGVAGAAGGG